VHKVEYIKLAKTFMVQLNSQQKERKQKILSTILKFLIDFVVECHAGV